METLLSEIELMVKFKFTSRTELKVFLDREGIPYLIGGSRSVVTTTDAINKALGLHQQQELYEDARKGDRESINSTMGPIAPTLEDIAEFLRDLQPMVPINIALLDSGDIAHFLRMSRRNIRERITCKPHFPNPIRMPSEKGRGHCRWKALDVIHWAEKLEE